MSELKIETVIDGEIWSQKQLTRLRYERALHALHELKYRGAKVCDGDVELGHEDINWLDPDRVEQVNIETRARLGESGTLDLLRDVLADSDRRWKKFAEGYVEGEFWVGQSDLEITGVTPQELLAGENEGDPIFAYKVMPEHYLVLGTLAQGQTVMENFGMFGEPVYTALDPEELPPLFAEHRDAAYPMAMFSWVKLVSDGTPIHVAAFHQFKPSLIGFSVRSMFFCPKTAPKAVADGHQFHFALELSGAIELAYAKKIGAAA